MKRIIGCTLSYLTSTGFIDAGSFKFCINNTHAISIAVYYNKETNNVLHKIFRHKQYIATVLPPYRIKERDLVYSRIFKGTFYKYTRHVAFSANTKMQILYE